MSKKEDKFIQTTTMRHNVKGKVSNMGSRVYKEENTEVTETT